MTLVDKLLTHQLTSLDIDASFEGSWLGEGILQLLPKTGWRQATILSAGIHGNETAPVELLLDLMQKIITTREYQGHAVLLIFGHIPAMQAAKRYLTEDMNRLFCGRHQQQPGTHYEVLRAAEVENAVAHFFSCTGEADQIPRFHLDMHTAIRRSYFEKFALLPAVNTPISLVFNDFLQSADVEAVVQHTEAGSTFSHFTAAEYLAQSATLELGKVAPFGNNDLSRYVAVSDALWAFITEHALPVRRQPPLVKFCVQRSVIKGEQQFILHLDTAVKNFTQLAEGYLLAEQSTQQWRVEGTARYLLFPNAGVAIGQRACLLLQKIAD